MIRKFLFSLCLAFLPFLAQADTIGELIRSLPEQAAAKQWVMQVAKRNLTEEQASMFVREAYTRAIEAELKPHTVLAVMRLESRFDPNARSREGASGLMQVIPRYHKDKLAGESVFNPKTNIRVGVRILKDCFVKHKGNELRAMSCYSGGGGLKYLTLVKDFNRTVTAYVKGTPNPSVMLAGDNQVLLH